MKLKKQSENRRYIISASRRTDIPAFFSEWFINRLKAGYCHVKNPFNPNQVSQVSLLPEDVAAFVFWTRNPAPFGQALSLLDAMNYKYGFLITVTGYPEELEPHTPEIDEINKTIADLADKIGKDKIVWRYDPILFSDKIDFAWHQRNFADLTKRLAPITGGCIISLLDFYRKTIKNLKAVEEHHFIENPCKLEGLLSFLTELHRIATENSLKIQTCCEDNSIFEKAGILPGGCIDASWIEKIAGKEITLTRHKGQRKNCRCVFSKDIGAYNSCRYGCRYCYATDDIAKALQRSHDSENEFL
jgi:hypothetical protein